MTRPTVHRQDHPLAQAHSPTLWRRAARWCT
jgi:hypothetical protein